MLFEEIKKEAEEAAEKVIRGEKEKIYKEIAETLPIKEDKELKNLMDYVDVKIKEEKEAEYIKEIEEAKQRAEKEIKEKYEVDKKSEWGSLVKELSENMKEKEETGENNND